MRQVISRYFSLFFVGEPGYLKDDSIIALRSGFVHGGLPALILEQTTQLEVFVDALYRRELEEVLCCAAGDEVFRCFRVAIRQLHVFSGGEMVGEPGLTAFGLPPDPISHDEAFVGVTLFVYLFSVEKISAIAAAGWRIGAGCFHPKIKLGETRDMRQINTWANGSASGRTDGVYIIVGPRVRV